MVGLYLDSALSPGSPRTPVKRRSYSINRVALGKCWAMDASIMSQCEVVQAGFPRSFDAKFLARSKFATTFRWLPSQTKTYTHHVVLRPIASTPTNIHIPSSRLCCSLSAQISSCSLTLRLYSPARPERVTNCEGRMGRRCGIRSMRSNVRERGIRPRRF